MKEFVEHKNLHGLRIYNMYQNIILTVALLSSCILTKFYYRQFVSFQTLTDFHAFVFLHYMMII